MFKIGDVVIVNPIYNGIDGFLDGTFVIIKKDYKLSNTNTSFIESIDTHRQYEIVTNYLLLDKTYYRKQKINKIYSKWSGE